jgi:hypothetical protein
METLFCIVRKAASSKIRGKKCQVKSLVSSAIFSLNLVGRGSSSIHKQVQTCYGSANHKPFLGLHGK